jgi:hypothetical protein
MRGNRRASPLAAGPPRRSAALCRRSPRCCRWRSPLRPRRPPLAGGPAGARRSTSSISPASRGGSGARRPGRRPQLLGDLVRAVPARDAVARRDGGAAPREGVVVAAINYKETPDVIRRFLERAPFKSQILLDADGDATVTWTPRVFPSTVLVGRTASRCTSSSASSTGRAPRPGAPRPARRCDRPAPSRRAKPSPATPPGARR